MTEFHNKRVRFRIYDTREGDWGFIGMDSLTVPSFGCETGVCVFVYV